MITQVSVEGYKSIRDRQTLSFRALTLLSGANSSGKSSIMQPLLLLKQTMEGPIDVGPLNIDGPNVEFTDAVHQMFSRGEKGRAKRMTFAFTADEMTAELEFTGRREELELSRMRLKSERFNVVLRAGTQGDELVRSLPKEFRDLLLTFRDILAKRDVPLVPSVVRNRCFLDVTLADAEDQFLNIPMLLPVTLVAENLKKILHVPAIRLISERAYPKTMSGRHFPGEFDDYVGGLIYKWQESDDERLPLVVRDLTRLGLAHSLRANVLSDIEVQLLITDRASSKMTIDIADVGFGVTQVLPVIVALHAAGPDDLIYIEEPESHLHPRAQSVLGDVLADSINSGRRIVIETHSEILLLALQQAVADGKIRHDDVALHWFSRDGGNTTISSGTMTRLGQYFDWPVDFGSTMIDAQNRYFQSAQKASTAVEQ